MIRSLLGAFIGALVGSLILDAIKQTKARRFEKQWSSVFVAVPTVQHTVNREVDGGLN